MPAVPYTTENIQLNEYFSICQKLKYIHVQNMESVYLNYTENQQVNNDYELTKLKIK